jgi:tRNA dimethylallyltransferase
MGKPKIIVILGATASGKTGLGIELAKKFNAEIISADSRQVYKGLDIGSAKVENIKPKNRTAFQKKYGYCVAEGIPHWLIDVVDYKTKTFTVAEFQKMADKVIADIVSRGKTPFLVGGSMLYLDAITRGINFAPKSDLKIRKQLEKKDLVNLVEQLKKLDPLAAKTVDLKNQRRVARALEVRLTSGQSFTSFKNDQPQYEVLELGIDWPREKLYQRIDQRVDERMDQGMVKEIKKLLARGISDKKLEKLGLEYRFITQYVRGKIKTQDEAITILKGATHKFVRRQLIWWRKNPKIIWIYPERSRRVTNQNQFEKQIKNFLT